MAHEDSPDLIFSSKTQTSKELQAVLSEDGYSQFQATDLSDAAPEPEPPAGDPPADPPEDPAAPPPDPAAPAPPAAPAGDPPAEPKPKGKPGSQREKEKRQQLETDLEKERTEKQAVLAEKDRLAAQLAALQSNPPAAAPPAPLPAAGATPAPAATAPAAAPEPKEEDFEGDIIAFAVAKAVWQVKEDQRKSAESTRLANEQAETDKRTKEAKDAQDRLAAQQAADNERWNAQVAKAKETHPDLDELYARVQKDNSIIGEQLLAVCVRDREDGAELMYYLFSHPEEENRLSKLVKPPANATERQIRMLAVTAHAELNKLAAQLSSASPQPAAPAAAPLAAPAAPQPPPPAQAPNVPAKPVPPTPVGQRQASSYRRIEQMSQQELRDMPLDEYRKRRDAGEG